MCAIAVPICTVLAIFGDRVSYAVHKYYESHRPHIQMKMPQRLNEFFQRRDLPAPQEQRH